MLPNHCCDTVQGPAAPRAGSQAQPPQPWQPMPAGPLTTLASAGLASHKRGRDSSPFLAASSVHWFVAAGRHDTGGEGGVGCCGDKGAGVAGTGNVDGDVVAGGSGEVG